VVSYWQSRVFKLRLKLLSEWDCLTESGMSFQILGAQQEKLFCPKLLLQRGTDNKFCYVDANLSFCKGTLLCSKTLPMCLLVEHLRRSSYL